MRAYRPRRHAATAATKSLRHSAGRGRRWHAPDAAGAIRGAKARPTHGPKADRTRQRRSPRTNAASRHRVGADPSGRGPGGACGEMAKSWRYGRSHRRPAIRSPMLELLPRPSIRPPITRSLAPHKANIRHGSLQFCAGGTPSGKGDQVPKLSHPGSRRGDRHQGICVCPSRTSRLGVARFARGRTEKLDLAGGSAFAACDKVGKHRTRVTSVSAPLSHACARLRRRRSTDFCPRYAAAKQAGGIVPRCFPARLSRKNRARPVAIADDPCYKPVAARAVDAVND